MLNNLLLYGILVLENFPFTAFLTQPLVFRYIRLGARDIKGDLFNRRKYLFILFQNDEKGYGSRLIGTSDTNGSAYFSVVNLVTVRNEVAKVMFLHLSVILFTGGSASVHAGIPHPHTPGSTPQEAHTHPRKYTPLGSTPHPPGSTPPRSTPLGNTPPRSITPLFFLFFSLFFSLFSFF